ncbi:E3 ubiquitin/ISG15 ligase TRIM25-like isoform X1 [Oncorhynchus keta]|uniref:E3 ubiquitin/ISG15 ligase TRIM25-like isoform X1 n=2 Tax=Oncorhynchus keta TaxID=8018 RepID=UPI0015FC55C3|nr:E3 ubiquitin/ISG15 ligase TRIM25-like isoform X1 [Oncorhynchus keta]
MPSIVPFPFCVPVDKTVVMASLEEELTCSVCRDVFSQAQPLPCGHSFCPACVREAWGHGEAGVRGRFTCAQCQEEQGVVACDCCPPVGDGDQSGNAAAVKTCLRCEVSLCAEHLKPHLERPAFKTHLLVEPLGDLSHRRCPAHEEMFRYYCADERVYVCADCLMEGGHTQHRVKGLRKVEEDLKVILQSLLQKADEKLNKGEQILQEHWNTDRTITDLSVADDSQVERMGIALQLQVERLVLALRESTRKERQHAVDRLQNNCSRVREDLSQTRDIHHYLGSLLEETDPFLLIWAFQSDDSRLLADLNCPLFTPDSLSLDRKYIMEDIESKYREFITETLRCLTELKRELLTSPLTMDTNSAHPLLSISDGLRSAMRVKQRLPCATHPDRFDHWAQVLTVQTFSSGTHYWELEAEGFWDIAVSYRSIGRKGKEGTAFGNNKMSWSLTQQHDRKLAAWHNRRKTRLSSRMSGNRVGVALDYGIGTITFSEVGPSNTLTHLHTFSTSFNQPVCLGFGLYKAELHSRISIVRV